MKGGDPESLHVVIIHSGSPKSDDYNEGEENDYHSKVRIELTRGSVR